MMEIVKWLLITCGIIGIGTLCAVIVLVFVFMGITFKTVFYEIKRMHRD